MLVSNLTDDSDEGTEVVSSLIERRVDGIVAAAPQLKDDLKVAEFLCAMSFRQPPPRPRRRRAIGGVQPSRSWPSAAQHLLDCGPAGYRYGRRAVPAASSRSRLRGAEGPLLEAGVETSEDLVVEADWSAGGGPAAATSLLLQREPRIDAIFVHSDLMAVRRARGLAANGRRVPDDVAVVSCDDLPFAAHSAPPGLTTVRAAVC